MDIEKMREAIIAADPTIMQRLSDLCKKRGQEGAELSVLDTSLRCNNPLKGPSYDKMRVFSFANYLAWKEQSGALGMEKCKMIRILYVYGYGGSRLSSSVEKLRRHLPEDRFEVFCYEYPQRDCWMALQFLKQKIGIHQDLIPSGHKLSEEAMPMIAQHILQYFHSQELALYEEQYLG